MVKTGAATITVRKTKRPVVVDRLEVVIRMVVVMIAVLLIQVTVREVLLQDVAQPLVYTPSANPAASHG